MACSERIEILLRQVSVQRGGQWVLQDVSLRLQGGQRWALLGDNGAGKTQLLKVLAADVWPTPTGREELTYSVAGVPMERIEAKPRIVYLGAERQDKYARYDWNLAVGDLLATGLHKTDILLGPVLPQQRRRVAAMLRACGLTQLATRKFLSLSYGQKRLALLARALVQRPDWLLLDEFYNGLDAEYRRRIDAILATARRRGQSWIAAAHRAIDVPRGTTRLLELQEGRVRRIAPLRRAALTRLTHSAAEKPGNSSRRRGPRQAPAGKVLLRLTNADLYVEYRRVLRNVNWDLRAGENWAVTGANASGKSSFLKLLYGDLSPAFGGGIERGGFPAGTPIEAWKRTVGYVSPELQADYASDVSLVDLVVSGRYSSIGLADRPTSSDRRIAARWLEFFELSAVATRRPREISYGQMRRALLARALAANPRILLLDEPLTGLDPGQRAATKRLLERLMARRVSVVIAVHHAEDLPRGIARTLHLYKREVHCTDPEPRKPSCP